MTGFPGFSVRVARAVLVVWGIGLTAWPSQAAEPIRVLFLGDNGPHQPLRRFDELAPVLEKRGIDLKYTDDANVLNAATLARFDALMIYANITQITPAQEAALLEYVSKGGGFLPVHCASFCFHNSPKYIALVGAQFQRHGTGIFRTEVMGTHPLVKGFDGFESWDETYQHHRHNTENRTVLEHRVQGEQREPWTWIRTHNRGRIFYTAWGHDQRTWTHPGFHNLIERGIRWTTRNSLANMPDFTDAPQMTKTPDKLPPFQYQPAKIPNYLAGQKWGTQGDVDGRMQLPLSPAESQRHLTTPVDFQTSLFASEPQIGKPICMNWDARGRLWIAETVDYPNELQPQGAGRDRIRICTDTDNDGIADKFIVFAEKLSIPTSLAFAYDGVIVHQAPHTLFLRDTDGDDVADEREVLFTGWNTNDTHAGPSNLTYGHDGWYYGMVGYSGFVGQVGGERHNFRTGFYRFQVSKSDAGKVQATKLEFLRNTNNNSWGVSFNENGELFGSTANGNPSVHLPIPNRYYERVRGWSSSVLGSIALDSQFDPVTKQVRQVDHHGNFTAAAGHAVYTARNYPRTYWNRTAFVNGPTGHLTATFLLQDDGASFLSRNAWNLLASDDEWTAPIMAEVGPDGNVWVIDWYNYIVQHNPTPAGFETGKGNAYKTDLRDKKHGRIYRVVPAGDTAVSTMSLADATPRELVAALKNDNLFWRRHAQRLLIEQQATAMAGELWELVADPSVDEIGVNVAAIHALQTLHALGQIDENAELPEALMMALRHASPGVRRNALQVLPRSASSTAALVKSFVLQDPDAHVRLQAFLTLSDLPPNTDSVKALTAAVLARENQQDRWLMDALTSAAAHDPSQFLTVFAEQQRVLQTVATWNSRRPKDMPTVVTALLERVSEHAVRSEQLGAPQLAALLTSDAPAVATAVLTGIERGAGNRPLADWNAAVDEQVLAALPGLPAESRSLLIKLAVRSGSQSMQQKLAELATAWLKTAGDEKLPDAERIIAAVQLVEFQPDNAKYTANLLDLVTPQSSPAFVTGIVQATGRSQAAAAGTQLVSIVGQLTPVGRKQVVSTLLSRQSWTAQLLTALDKGSLQLADLTLDQRQALANHPDRKLAAQAQRLLKRGGGLPNADRAKVLAELLPLTAKSGDATAGLEVFKKQCAKCHIHGQLGARIGPDLTGMAVHTKEELLTQILDPSRSVEGNFRVYSVATLDGKTLSGLLMSENKTAIELVDTEAKKQVILREDIAQFKASTKSLMPEGFEKQLKPDDFINLLEFLKQRGRFLPLPLAKVATSISTRGMFFSREAVAERLVFSDWQPKTFQGVPFQLVDPQDGKQANVVLLHGPSGNFPPKMPRQVELPVNSPARVIHFLSGVGGWAFPLGQKGSVSLIVRLTYNDGSVENHELKNGIHFADYIRRVDVPESKFAFHAGTAQLRYLTITPEKPLPIKTLKLIKGPDNTAPLVIAITVESPVTSTTE